MPAEQGEKDEDAQHPGTALSDEEGSLFRPIWEKCLFSTWRRLTA
ncbi:hypothetical protein [Paenibacillus albicereus]|nr:hypothetical protein [Paenibacillus albicereus]